SSRRQSRPERVHRNGYAGRRDPHRRWRTTRRADRWSNPGRVRSHTKNTVKLISLTREEEQLSKPLCTETKGSSRCEFEYISYYRYHRYFHLRKMKSRDYLETRVQLDDARQRERGKQHAGGHGSLQDSSRWRPQ